MLFFLPPPPIQWDGTAPHKIAHRTPRPSSIRSFQDIYRWFLRRCFFGIFLICKIFTIYQAFLVQKVKSFSIRFFGLKFFVFHGNFSRISFANFLQKKVRHFLLDTKSRAVWCKSDAHFQAQTHHSQCRFLACVLRRLFSGFFAKKMFGACVFFPKGRKSFKTMPFRRCCLIECWKGFFPSVIWFECVKWECPNVRCLFAPPPTANWRSGQSTNMIRQDPTHGPIFCSKVWNHRVKTPQATALAVSNTTHPTHTSINQRLLHTVHTGVQPSAKLIPLNGMFDRQSPPTGFTDECNFTGLFFSSFKWAF